MEDCPVTVIGNYIPPNGADRSDIHEALSGIIKRAGITVGNQVVDLEIRDPLWHVTRLTSKIELESCVWHKDAGWTKDRFLTWAYPEPTEFKLPRKRKIFMFAPGDILVVDNQKVMHRTPRNIGRNRWFARATVL